MQTPQLFINYKLKSVAHLPWKVFCFKALSTFIDDLFAFIIRMPTMHRLSCLRDDIVFFIYLYQVSQTFNVTDFRQEALLALNLLYVTHVKLLLVYPALVVPCRSPEA